MDERAMAKKGQLFPSTRDVFHSHAAKPSQPTEFRISEAK